MVLDSILKYAELVLDGVGEMVRLLDAIKDLKARLVEFENIHEGFFQKD